MYLAETGPNERIAATPGAAGACPICHMEVIPKCGEIKTWHWAHKSLKDCDHWAEPESEWHLGWKKLAGLDNSEVVIRKDEGIHRADIKIDNRVIELQHSSLSPKDVREREEFYGNMIWVIDGDELLKNAILERWISKEETFYHTFTCKIPAWIKEIQKPIFYHFKKLSAHTYFWTYRYHVHKLSYMAGHSNAWDTIQEKIEKKWNKACVDGYPETYEDILISPGKEKNYCSTISKAQFKKSMLTSRKPSPPPKSLFNF